VILDSHVHLWRAADGYAVPIREKIAGLDRDCDLAALARAAGPAMPDRIIVVQATAT
jgi:predicted TIM-barrel fold metal-dependent hydrolase